MSFQSLDVSITQREFIEQLLCGRQEWGVADRMENQTDMVPACLNLTGMIQG